MRLWLWLSTSLLPCSHGKTLFDHVTSQCFFLSKNSYCFYVLGNLLGFWKGKYKHKSPRNVAVDVSPLLPSFCFCFCFFFFFRQHRVTGVISSSTSSRVWELNFFGCPTSFLLLVLPHYSLITLILPPISSIRPHFVAYVTQTHTHLFLYLLIIVIHYVPLFLTNET